MPTGTHIVNPDNVLALLLGKQGGVYAWAFYNDRKVGFYRLEHAGVLGADWISMDPDQLEEDVAVFMELKPDAIDGRLLGAIVATREAASRAK